MAPPTRKYTSKQQQYGLWLMLPGWNEGLKPTEARELQRSLVNILRARRRAQTKTAKVFKELAEDTSDKLAHGHDPVWG